MSKREPLDIVARAAALEQQFTAPLTQNQRAQLENYFTEMSVEEALKRASGSANDEIIKTLASEGVRPQTMFVVSIVPLIEVAWADDEVQDAEREALLTGSAEHGFHPEQIKYQAVEAWLKTRPTPELFSTWVDYISALDEHLFARERKQLMALLVDRTQAIAKAAGGFLGLRSICERETRVIEKLQDAFRYPEQFADMWTPEKPDDSGDA